MSRSKCDEDRRMQKFEVVYERWQRRELSQAEAGELLGRSERQFRRYVDAFEESGLEGLRDGRLGRQSSNATPAAVIAAVLALYRNTYRGWNVKHFHEHLVKRHGYTLSYSLVKNRLQDADLVRPERRKGGHRRKRERKPCVGMMLHQDASKHVWLAGEPALDLVVTMDDATSEIYSAFLVEEEGTMSTFEACLSVFAAHGVPASLYTDRGSHYFTTPEAGGKVDKEHPTQVGRALDRLGVEHIAAYSPEARGRSERMFGTLQDRMVNELKLAGISGVAAANRWIGAVYLPEHNRRFTHPPALPESGFVAVERARLVETLCVEEERVVARDNTIAWSGQRLQLPESPLRRHYVGATVKVHAYPDGTLGVLHGLRSLCRFAALDGDGRFAAWEPAPASPTPSSMAACSGPSRSGLEASADAAAPACRPSLTAPARAAATDVRVGTKKGKQELRRGHEPRKDRTRKKAL